MHKTLLLSSAYFPPVSWFAVLLSNESAQIEAYETYQKQTYRNRCNILGPDGLQSLTVPVSKPFGNHSKTNEIIISTENDWKRRHFRSIETAYNSSPFFLYYRDRITKVLSVPHQYLLSLNHSLLNLIFEMLNIKSEVKFTTAFEKEPANAFDLRNTIQPGKVFLPADFFPVYTQVFSARSAFIPDLSILDLLFNEGPASLDYLKTIISTLKDDFLTPQIK